MPLCEVSNAVVFVLGPESVILKCEHFVDTNFHNGLGVGRTQIPTALRREMAYDHKRAVILDNEKT